MVGRAVVEATARGVDRAAGRATTEQELLGEVARLVEQVVPHRGAAWLSTDPATTLFTDGVVVDFMPETCHPWFHNELHVDDVHKFRHIAGSGAAVLSRAGGRRRSARWEHIMRPQGLDDELRLTMEDTTGTWGVVELHRQVGDPDFTGDEARLLERLAPVVARGLRRIAVGRAASTCDVPDGPGLIVVHEDGHARAVTEAGGRWLDALTDPMPAGHARTSLLTIATAARAAGIPSGDARVRARARDGSWVTLHAQPTLQGGDVAVIVEPMRSTEIAVLLARAYGLSGREQEVVLMLARGRTTFEVADALHLSVHTVRDHVKASLGKVGVNSRSELIAALFDRHYAPRFFGTSDRDGHPPG